MFINPEKFFLTIQNPINKNMENFLKKIYKTVNMYNEKNIPNFQENYQVKILKTFSF